MLPLIGFVIVGLLCLLGGCTALWWFARLVNMFFGMDERDETPASASRDAVLRDLRAAIEKDFTNGALNSELYDALNAYMRQLESAATAVPPAIVADQPARALQRTEIAPATALPPEAVAPRSLARADKSHVPQSLGIVALYLFVISFVHSQVWAAATPLQHCLLLVTATLLAFGTGNALCRWTSLRVTGIAFALFAHAATVFDAWALGSQSNVLEGSPLVWTVTTTAVALSAALHARFLRASLFETVAVGGVLVAWGFGALHLQVPLILLPAAYVPLVIAAGLISRGDAAPRWSYHWSLRLTWRVASVLLAFGLPVSGFLSDAPYVPQALALLALGVALAADGGLLSLLCTGVVLLVPAPLYAFKADWATEYWIAAFAIPGAVLAGGGLLAHFLSPARWTPRLRAVALWSQAAVGIALALSIFLRFQGSAPQLLPVAVAFCVSTSCAALLASAVWSWLAVASAGLSAVGICDAWQWSSALWPLLWTATATAVRVITTSSAETGHRHARLAADVLTGMALAGLLVLLVGVYSQALQPDFIIALGWLAAAGYLLISRWSDSRLRQDIGWVCLGPALAMSFYAAGSDCCLPALFLALLTLVRAAFELLHGIRRPEVGAAVRLWPAGLLALHTAILALRAGHEQAPWLAGISLLLLAGAGLLLGLRLRVAHLFGKAAAIETLSFALVAGAAWEVLPIISADRAFDPLRAALAIACSLLVSWVVSILSEPVVLSFPSRTAANPYRKAGEFACLGLTGIYFGLFIQWWLISRDAGMALWATWLPAVAPMAVWIRHSAEGSRKAAAMTDAGYFGWAGGAFFTGTFCIWTLIACAVAKFWQPACPVDLRSACVAFFATVLLVSALVGRHLRDPIAPVAGLLALFGLMAGACGVWKLPLEALVLWGAVVVWVYGLLAQAAGDGTGPSFLRWELASLLRLLSVSCAVAALSAAALFCLDESPHPWCLAAALLMMLWWLRGAGATFLRGAPAALLSTTFRLQVFAFSISLALVASHALLLARARSGGLAVGLGGVMLAMLALRQLLAWSSASAETLAAARAAFTWPAVCIAASSFALTLAAKVRQDMLVCCVAVAELVLGAWGLTVLLRRGSIQVRGLWAGEAAGWMLLVFGLSAVAEHFQIRDPLFWTICAAGLWVVGRVAEPLASVVAGSGSPQADASPPFLETRSFAAMLVAILGLLLAIFRLHTDRPLDETFLPTLGGTALLTVAGAHVSWSRDTRVNAGARAACAFGAYVLLLPAAWLICAEARFASFAPLAFFALAPVMALIARRYRRAGQAGHARAAHLGAGVISVSACALGCYGLPHSSIAILILTVCAALLLLFLLRRVLGWRALGALVGLGVICGAFGLMR